MIIISSGLEIFGTHNIYIHNINCKLSYSSSKVQYFAAKNSYYYTFFPKLKHSLAKNVNLGFSMYKCKVILSRLNLSQY